MSARQRLSFDPVDRLMVHHPAGVPFTIDEIATVLRCTPDRVKRMRRVGLDVWQADRVACALGRIAWDLWPEWLPMLDDRCKVPDEDRMVAA